MNEQQLESLLENEKEWRRYMVEQVEKMREDVTALKMWSLVFRLAGAGAVTALWILIEVKLSQ